MKQIESKLKIHSKTWITPVLLIVIAFFAMAMVGPVNAAPLSQCGTDFCDQDGDSYIRDHKKCLACGGITDCDDNLKDNEDPNPCDGGSSGGNEIGPFNLARASFATFDQLGSTGGITADGEDFCTISRDGLVVTYDYWAWEERLLVGTGESIHDLDASCLSSLNITENTTCCSHDNRSDVSSGGRWKLLTTAGPDADWHVARWLVVDFSAPSSAVCPDLDGNEGIFDELYGIYRPGQHPNPSDERCVDNLTVWLNADRILKNNANFQGVGLTIAHWPDPDVPDAWQPWGKISYIDSLYLRNPSENTNDPFYGRDCRVMSTRETWNDDHTRARAELYMKDPEHSPTNIWIGEYYLPLEVCVIRASD